MALQRWVGERVAAVAARDAARPISRRAILALLPRMFRPDAAVDLEARFALFVGDAVFGLRVRDRRLTVVPDQVEPEAGATVRIEADDLVRLAAGSATWPQLLADGRMRLEGDPFLGLRFPLLFGITQRPQRTPSSARTPRSSPPGRTVAPRPR